MLKDYKLNQTVTSRSLTKFTVKGTVMQSLIVTQLRFTVFYGGQNFVCSRGSITGLHPKTEESSPNPHTLFVTNLFSYRKKVDLWQACSTFYVVWVTLATCGLHAGNMKFNKQDEE
jgi:hypothetical protein